MYKDNPFVQHIRTKDILDNINKMLEENSK